MTIPFDIPSILPFMARNRSRSRTRAQAEPIQRETMAERTRTRPSILPKNFLVEFIAGTFGPASSGKGLTDHLVGEERLRRVVTRTNIGVMTAQDLEENSRRKLEEIQVTRAVKFKHTIEQIVDTIDQAATRDSDRHHVIRELFALDESNVGEQLAKQMAESRFLERLFDESYEIVDGPFSALRQTATANHFIEVEGRFRKEFSCFLPEYEEDRQGVRHALSDDKSLKIINRIFDAFAPRMLLIGHSQGGLVALRAMQLGMRRVRVKDKRRFLYSPRSGRVHRYSPVAMAIGLGAPFDGIDQSPREFGPLGPDSLRQDNLPAYVRALMPGVAQMVHGSPFLKKMRGAFIPFDCSAMSIANPKDGFVPLDRTRLPVGDFRNMHNLSVGSRASFDVVDVAPDFSRAAFEYWPMTQLRKLLNENPRFEGLRQHCSFLIDLGENWDVDKGEIVRRIFTSDYGERLFDEMAYEVNFDGLREQLMANLLYRLRAANEDERKHLAWMAPRLDQMIRDEALPFLNSVDKRAALALNYIEPQ